MHEQNPAVKDHERAPLRVYQPSQLVAGEKRCAASHGRCWQLWCTAMGSTKGDDLGRVAYLHWILWFETSFSIVTLFVCVSNSGHSMSFTIHIYIKVRKKYSGCINVQNESTTAVDQVRYFRWWGNYQLANGEAFPMVRLMFSLISNCLSFISVTDFPFKAAFAVGCLKTIHTIIACLISTSYCHVVCDEENNMEAIENVVQKTVNRTTQSSVPRCNDLQHCVLRKMTLTIVSK